MNKFAKSMAYLGAFAIVVALMTAKPKDLIANTGGERVAKDDLSPISKPRGKLRWSAFAVFIAALALAASVYQGWVARDQEKRQLRAYVYVVPVVRDFQVAKQPVIGVTIKNGGQTPAYDFSVALNGDILPYPQTGSLRTEGYQPGAIQISHEVGVGAFIYQSHEYTLTAKGKNLPTRADYDEVMNGSKKRLYVWGRLLYLDAFWKHHFLDFCFTFNGDELASNSYYYCSDDNDTDH